jgi:hypothetical protein
MDLYFLFALQGFLSNGMEIHRTSSACLRNVRICRFQNKWRTWQLRFALFHRTCGNDPFHDNLNIP